MSFGFTCPCCRNSGTLFGFPCPECSLDLGALTALVDDLYDPPREAMVMRQFETGATRDDDENKLDYEGFLSPLVLKRYAEYMHKHRMQSDHAQRSSDNWQKGIPRDQYMKSAWRHFLHWWSEHRGVNRRPGTMFDEEAVCALMFNAMGYLHEILKDREADDALQLAPEYREIATQTDVQKGQVVYLNTDYARGYADAQKDFQLERQT